MRLWITSVLLLAVVGLVVLAILIREIPHELAPVDAVEVEVTSGQVTFEGEAVNAGETVAAKANGEGSKLAVSDPPDVSTFADDRVEDPTPTPVLDPNLLSIHVVDALGDSIQNARVEVAGKIHDSTNGLFSIPGLDEGAQTVTASAEGYASVQKKVQLPSHEVVEIPLEYTCSFEITVLNSPEGGVPVTGAEVKIWEGPEVPRPVGDSLTVRRRNILWDAWDDSIVLRREDGRIRVTDTVGEGRFRFETHPGSPIPRKGDTITGLTYDRRPTQLRSLLRLWDSLAVLCPSGEDSEQSLWMELNCDGSDFTGSFYGAGKARRMLVDSTVTDAEGKCAFRDLPARLYFASAQSSGMVSFIHRICPSFSATTIPLFPEDQNKLIIRAIKKDATYYKEKGIGEAEVRIRASGRMVLISGITDRWGETILKPLPSGEYKVTITLPEAANAVPVQKTVEVCIEEPSTHLVVPFEVRDKYRVAGRVLRADTGKPVAGYHVQLSCEIHRMTKEEMRKAEEEMLRKLRRTFPKEYGGYAVTETNRNGEFEFYPVEYGEYLIENSLTVHTPERSFDGYVPAPPQGQALDKDPHFWIENADVTGLEIYVLPGVMTHFSGQVLMADGEPAGSATVVLNAGRDSVSASTYEDGNFEMNLFTVPNDDPVTGVFEVEKKYNEGEAKTVLKNGQQLLGVVWGPKGEIRGTLAIEYRPGDTIENITIVLEPEETGPILTGVLKTEAGIVPELVQFFSLRASQDSLEWISNNARIQENGSYSVELKGFQPGAFMFELNCSQPEPKSGEMNQLHLPPPANYLSQWIELALPENAEVLHHDFVLEEASYFYGKVVDQDYKPVAKVRVRAYDAAAPSYAAAHGVSGEIGYRATSDTDVNGMFLLDGIRRDLKYKLEVGELSGSGTPLAELDNLKPPSDNIVIQVKLEETAK